LPDAAPEWWVESLLRLQPDGPHRREPLTTPALTPWRLPPSQRNCPTANGAGRGGFAGRGGGGRGGFGPTPRSATCYKCGGPNHYARDCQAQAMKCYACGKLGHISRDCTSPNGGPLAENQGKTCYRCGEVGHISKSCPQAQGDVNGVGAAQEPAEAAATPAAVPTPAQAAAA
jgi:cellular nucleic acid-binding protein